MKLQFNIKEDDIKSLLCFAFEGGSNYWYSLTYYQYAKGIQYQDFQVGGKFQTENYWHPVEIIPLVKGCSVILHDKQDNNKECRKLNLKSIKEGFNTMMNKYPRHFGNFLSDNYDAVTGDVFLQCCLFGEVKYG